MPQLNKFEIEMFAKRAAQDLLEHGRDLNESITEIATVNGLNRNQVQRVVEAANTVANGELVKRAKVKGEDPRISFALADSDAIWARQTAATPEAKVAHQKNVDALASLFKVPAAKPAVEKVASGPREPRLSAMSGPQLCGAYIAGQDVSAQSFTTGQLTDAVDELGRTRDVAREKWAQLALAEEDTLGRFAAAVESELHAGCTPATIKEALARAPVLDEHRDVALLIVNAKAQELGTREGQSAIKTATIVDEASPVITELCALLLIDGARDAVIQADAKVADAEARANVDLRKALAAGSDKLAVNLATVQQGARNLGQQVKGVGGGAFKAVGIGLGAVETKNRAFAATQRLKKMQATPAVGAMKMAEEKLAEGGFAYTLRNMRPGPGALAAIALGTAVATGATVGAGKLMDLASRGVGSMFERRKRDKLFETLIARDPALKSQARAREYFDLVLTYAPALGDHPTAIGDFLKRQLQYPVSGVEFLGALAKLQNDISNARRQDPNPFTAGVGEAVRGAQSSWIKGNT